MKINILLIFLFIIFTTNSYATTIRVIDLQKIIDNNKILNELFNLIENDQTNHREKFKKQEIELESELQRINELKLILDNVELEKEINGYNEKLQNFNQEIEKFNIHYDNQINALKNKIINNILELLKKYSLDNQIDLIFDSNNYILSSNSINITDLILEQSYQLNLETDLEKY